MTPYHSEEWRIVPSRPWIEASSKGRIRAHYLMDMPHGGQRLRTVAPTKGALVAAALGAKAKRMIYRVRGETVKVHRLVCEAFHGPAPTGRERALKLAIASEKT